MVLVLVWSLFGLVWSDLALVWSWSWCGLIWSGLGVVLVWSGSWSWVSPAAVAHTQVKVVAEVGVHEGLITVVTQQVVRLHHRRWNHQNQE